MGTFLKNFWPIILVIFYISSSSGQIDPQTVEDLRNCLGNTDRFVARDELSETYRALNYQWNIRLPEIQPLGYYVPRNTADVQMAIRCGKALRIKMFPKGGGHSYEKYSFGNSQTVIVDLRNISSITVDPISKTAIVGAGVLTSNLYWELWANGKFGVPGGNCVGVGVSGLSLGGGHGFFSKRYGLTLDNVLEMVMVDAYGEIHVANSQNQADLYWALLGAGAGNFGIVTSFKYKIHDVSAHRVISIQFRYHPDSFKEVFAAHQSWNYNNQDGMGFCGLSIRPGALTISIFDADLSSADVEHVLKSFPTPSAGPVTIEEMNWIEFLAKSAHPPAANPEDLGQVKREDTAQISYRAKSYFSAKILTDEEIARIEPVLVRIPRNIFVELGTYGGAINQVPFNATSFVHRSHLYPIQLGIETETEGEWLIDFDMIVAPVLDSGESYQNYIDAQLIKNGAYLRRYYGHNLDRLINFKRWVDPENYFSFPQSIPVQWQHVNDETDEQ